MKKALQYIFVDWLLKPIVDLVNWLRAKDLELAGNNQTGRCPECGRFSWQERYLTREDLDKRREQADQAMEKLSKDFDDSNEAS